MEAKQTTRIGVYSVIRKEEKVLLCRLAKNVRTYGGYWSLPGGGLEFGENPEQTLVREVEEETGLIVQPGKLLGINSITRTIDLDHYQSIQIVYQANVLSGELRFEEVGTTDMCEWICLSNISKLDYVPLISAAFQMANLPLEK